LKNFYVLKGIKLHASQKNKITTIINFLNLLKSINFILFKTQNYKKLYIFHFLYELKFTMNN